MMKLKGHFTIPIGGKEKNAVSALIAAELLRVSFRKNAQNAGCQKIINLKIKLRINKLIFEAC